MSTWTLNDNPRVVAERRLRLLYDRLNWLNATYRKWILESGDDGMVDRMVWTGITHAQLDKSARVRKVIFREIDTTTKFLKAFR